jgi:hypothetical protein
MAYHRANFQSRLLMFVRLNLNRTPGQTANHIQITNFTDSAVAPALSPDSRKLVFIRSCRGLCRFFTHTGRALRAEEGAIKPLEQAITNPGYDLFITHRFPGRGKSLVGGICG